MNAGSRWVEGLYARALRLYPASFQDCYGGPMRQAFRDALTDSSFPRRKLFLTVARDLVTSLMKEHFAMFRETYFRPVLVFNALVLAGISSVLALALYLIPQQVMRNGANDPQIEMATNLAARLGRFGVAGGLQQGAGNNGSVVDMAHSLSPFVIVYNDRGQVLGSTGQLDGQTPVPPAGVFNSVRVHGEERVTWRPGGGPRIAAVVERVNGREPGFVLAGRSLREVQARIDHVRNLAGLTWLGMLALIAVGTFALGSMTRQKPSRTTV